MFPIQDNGSLQRSEHTSKKYGKERRDGAVDTVLFRLLQYQKSLKVHESRQYDLWHFLLLR